MSMTPYPPSKNTPLEDVISATCGYYIDFFISLRKLQGRSEFVVILPFYDFLFSKSYGVISSDECPGAHDYEEGQRSMDTYMI
ncbi:hypothetical protein O6P43_000605 [Quillaja saponaria]|uniref:Uncharacterized protein n=1 Tax=Quillaja saponaria TaxID=32244 RepID=A0AAD7QH44_QUISA|nr:hypothetical protein O6P43_000605 [Quillaja saponaria]